MFLNSVSSAFRWQGPTRFLVLAVIVLFLVGVAQATAPGRAVAFGPPCPDDDSDGFDQCAPGDSGDDGNPVDCDDADPDTYPGAPELRCSADGTPCDTVGIDDDCPPDESLADLRICRGDVGAKDNDCDGCALGSPCSLSSGPNGECVTGSYLTCPGEACPVPESGIEEYAPEGPLGADSCFDGQDNDCDDLIDHADADCTGPELCNGFDDDDNGTIDDGFDVGQPCSVGAGICANSGSYVCTPDGSSSVCSATALPAGVENTPGQGTCLDGLDNDCDGMIDLADDSCREPEKCDGLDNDGDGSIDEGFILGVPCDVGEGVCASSGFSICSPDGSGTICDAVPAVGLPEGPTGATCADGLDNDCDGDVDGADPGCSSADLTVTCALPYVDDDGVDDEDDPDDDPSIAVSGGPIDGDGESPRFSGGRHFGGALVTASGQDEDECTGLHRVEIHSFGGTPDTVVSAQLLILDPEGALLDILEVEDGDLLDLESELDPEEWRWVTRTSSDNTRHRVIAPVALLQVTAKNDLATAHAFCSNIPYLDVIKPSGAVTAEAEGEATSVLAALPRVDPESLAVVVDGVDVLSALGASPASLAAGTEFNGVVPLPNGDNATVSGLRVEIAPEIGMPSSNTLRMSIGGMGCGTHIFTIQGERLPGVAPTLESEACNPLDDFDGANAPDDCYCDNLLDKGESSVFLVELETPSDGDQTNQVPTPVRGEVCHGREIGSLKINGKPIDVGGQMVTPGDGETSGDLYELSFDVMVPATDLADKLSPSGASLGTFDPGANRVVAMATDVEGNRAFDSALFSVGPVIEPGVVSFTGGSGVTLSPEVVESLTDTEQQIGAMIERLALDVTAPRPTAVALLDNAVVLGISESAVRKVLAKKCSNYNTQFKNEVRANLLDRVVFDKKVSVGCSCDPRVRATINGVTFGGDLSCPVDFHDGRIAVGLDLPDVQISIRAYGYCKSTFLGLCVSRSTVNGYTTATLSDLGGEFDITEGQLLGTEPPGEPVLGSCMVGGQDCARDSDCPGGGNICEIGTFTAGAQIEVGIGCLANFCEWFVEGLAFIASVFGSDWKPFEFEFKVADAIGAGDPDPIDLKGVNVDGGPIANADQSLETELSDVQITTAGITAGLKGGIALVEGSADPEIPQSLGARATPAPLPALPVSGAMEIFLGLSDDSLNQMFANLVRQGKLKTGCRAATDADGFSLDVGSLLPEDCASIEIEQCVCNGGPNDGTTCEVDADCGGSPCECAPGVAATGLAAGICLSWKALDIADDGDALAFCESYVGAADEITDVAQATCHGVGRPSAACLQIPGTLAERLACIAARETLDFDIRASDPLLVCTQQEIPPYLLLSDDPGISGVQTTLVLNDLSVAMMVDRNHNGNDGDPATSPNCLDGEAPTSGDCNLFASCVEMAFDTTMRFDNTGNECPADKPGFYFEVTDARVGLEQGFICGGGQEVDDPGVIGEAADNDTITELTIDVNTLTPPICIQGLTLGEDFQISSPTVIVIEADGSIEFQDYLGLTGDLQD